VRVIKTLVLGHSRFNSYAPKPMFYFLNIA